jgi:NADH:ubiquinone oxidoreductase subunit 3 (subunit A)
MLYNYIALLIFVAFAAFVPASFLLAAKLLGRKSSGNPVKNAPYESGEETIGNSKDIDNEYLPHFMIFLPFEIIIVVLILWSTVTKTINLEVNIAILMLGVVATFLSFIGYRMARG